jgi:nitroreductase
MNTLDTIAARRSIRRFKDMPVPDEALAAVLTAGIQAPSGKNSQPWRFVVVRGEQRAEMVCAMRQGLANTRAQRQSLGSSEGSVRVMAEAPVTVFVFRPGGLHPWQERSIEQQFMDVVDVQSIGAAIENMCLAAEELGLGSLWVCDVFYAYLELAKWLGEEGQMVAALCLGYAGEAPPARPRKPLEQVVRWL